MQDDWIRLKDSSPNMYNDADLAAFCCRTCIPDNVHLSKSRHSCKTMCVCYAAYKTIKTVGGHRNYWYQALSKFGPTPPTEIRPFGKSAARDETLAAAIAKAVLSSAWCRCPGEGCSGEHSTNGSQHKGLDSLIPYRLSDLKYSSQRSCLFINIYFNKLYNQSAHGAPGMHGTPTAVCSFRKEMVTKYRKVWSSHRRMKYGRWCRAGLYFQ